MISKKISTLKKIYYDMGITGYLFGLLKRKYYKALKKKYNFDQWHVTPIEIRPYALQVVRIINGLNVVSVYEIGCGLGEILRKINAPIRVGYDIGSAEIECAKFLDKSNAINYFVGSFCDIKNQKIDCLVTVNFIHNIASTDLKRIYKDLVSVNNISYILVDSVLGSGYLYHHNFDDLMPEKFLKYKVMGPFENDRYLYVYKKEE